MTNVVRIGGLKNSVVHGVSFRMMRCAALAAVAGVAAMAGGCALIPVAALGVVGNVSDIGSTAFSVGTEVFSGGKLETVELCAFDEASWAVRSMLNDLRLRSDGVKVKEADAAFKFQDDNGDVDHIAVRRRTAAICQIQIDVGLTGSEAYARLLLKSIRARIALAANGATTRPVDPIDLLAPRPPTRSDTRPADSE